MNNIDYLDDIKQLRERSQELVDEIDEIKQKHGAETAADLDESGSRA